ncbi:MAG TPA: FAD-dependent oxidoreductase [Luteolibacter sp.]
MLNSPIQIIGQGLAGTCLAWTLFDRGVPFELVDREQGGSSRVAAGLVNPITGARFEPSWRIAEFLPGAVAFYQSLEERLGETFWYPLPVVRLAANAKEWAKISGKFGEPAAAPWVAGVIEPPQGEWAGAVELRGGGRLATRTFLDASREFFRERGLYRRAVVDPVSPAVGERVWCEGAAGLLVGRLGPHRCAKGEILTLRAIGWSEPRIRIGGGGWLVPLGDGCYKTGATYDWDHLDELPTEAGRAKVEAIARRLAPGPFEVIGHEAGIRPIVRRSQPLIGPLAGEWFFNGLGSKGSLYAPGMAVRLAAWLVDGVEPEAEVRLDEFLATQSADDR